MVSGNVKCLRLQTQDRKNQVSKLILGNFLNLFMILQILTSVKEITLVT